MVLMACSHRRAHVCAPFATYVQEIFSTACCMSDLSTGFHANLSLPLSRYLAPHGAIRSL
jgi:hypothetical protein